jgi:hypothetical protein
MRVGTVALLPACFLAFTAAGSLAPAAQSSMAPTAEPKIYAQHLVDLALAAHPGVVVLAVHATPPHRSANVIIASNIGRIGKRADTDDLHVIATGTSKLEVNKAGNRFEVEEPLKDVTGETLGAIGVVFPYTKGQDTKPDQRVAAEIQSFFQKHVLSDANLVDAYPYAPQFTPDNAAQALVDKTMARHPELLVLGMHVTLPGGRGNVMLGSNIGRIGKKADVDDMRVVNTGKSNYEVSENGKRYEVELVLEDASGRNIGALGTVFRYASPKDKAALNVAARKIRDEMAREIPTASALLAKV